MALTPSKMIPLGLEFPNFTLKDTITLQNISSKDIKGPILVMFLCCHCPYVKYVEHEVTNITKDYAKDFTIIAISSNDAVNYPDDSPENLKKMAQTLGWEFPYLYDESQEVARQFDAACTPDFFIYDQSRKLVYRGQLDDSRPSNGKPLNGKDLRDALEAVIKGEEVSLDQKASIGCNIKWKT